MNLPVSGSQVFRSSSYVSACLLKHAFELINSRVLTSAELRRAGNFPLELVNKKMDLHMIRKKRQAYLKPPPCHSSSPAGMLVIAFDATVKMNLSSDAAFVF